MSSTHVCACPGWLHGYKAQREHKKPDREAGDYCEDEASTNDFRTMMVRKEQYQREDRWQIYIRKKKKFFQTSTSRM
jgi:hypothetical protein